MKLKEKESDIQKAILDYLRLKKIFCFRSNCGAMPGEYKGKPWFVRFGMPGVSDIIGILTLNNLGVILCVEVKSLKGKQSDAQKEFQEKIQSAGGLYILAKSIDDVVYGIQEFKKKFIWKQ